MKGEAFARRVLLLAILFMVMASTRRSSAQAPIIAEIAPTGKVRVAFNANTPVLPTRAPDRAFTGGVGFELGKFIAGRFNTILELAAYPDSNTFTQSYGKGEWDIGFGARTPLMADKADFLLDVLLNKYWFIAAPGREFANANQVDRPKVKIGVGLHYSSDQFLSKTLKSAQVVRLTGGSGGKREIQH